MAKTFNCQGKKVKVEEKLFIKNGEVLGTVLTSDICPNAGFMDNNICKNCYGKVILVDLDEFNKKTKEFAPSKKIYRDTFTINKFGVVKELNATKFINECDILSRTSTDTKNNCGAMTSPWIAFDRPISWKTDCAECKAKFDITPCKNMEKNRAEGKSDYFCDQQKQRRIVFY